MIKNFIKENNIYCEENASLKKYNSYRLDTICDYLLFPKNIDELKKLISFLNINDYKYIVLGNGSNVIFNNNHYAGVVIKLDKFNDMILVDDLVTVGAGYSLIKLAMETSKIGLGGLEFAAGIPGLVGASTAMNAGAYNSSLSKVVTKALVLTPGLEIKEFTNKELNFSYRNSFLKEHKDYICLEITIRLTKTNPIELLELIEDRKKRRLSSQPLEFPSAGSVFRNPSESIYAGKLIEDLNLKGHSIGGAKISEKHANFIINENNATGEDIVNLINFIKEKVKEKYDIELLLEQIIIK